MSDKEEDNGSGKSTALNVMAEKIGINRDSIYNKSNFYPDYIQNATTKAEDGADLHVLGQ